MHSNKRVRTVVGPVGFSDSPLPVSRVRRARTGARAPVFLIGIEAAGYYAIRGREQQVIDHYGGVGNPQVANLIRGVSRYNLSGRLYHAAANASFGAAPRDRVALMAASLSEEQLRENALFPGAEQYRDDYLVAGQNGDLGGLRIAWREMQEGIASMARLKAS